MVTPRALAMSMYSIKIMITRLKRRASLNNGGGAHRLRHYFATRYLEAGGNINYLASSVNLLENPKYLHLRIPSCFHDCFLL